MTLHVSKMWNQITGGRSSTTDEVSATVCRDRVETEMGTSRACFTNGTVRDDAEPVAEAFVRTGEVLVLDDEPILSEMLGEMLGILGHQPTVCQDPGEALGMLKEREFDLILSDVRMPEMDGRAFYERAIELKPALAGRVVFITGDADSDDVKSFLDSMTTPHLTKPFDWSSVQNVLTHVLGQAAVSEGPVRRLAGPRHQSPGRHAAG